MKFSFKFSNLLGTVYRKGDLLFTPDGNSVISPVGNKITIYDLKNNKSSTLPIESRYNYTALDISPNCSTFIAVNEEGECQLVSMISRTVVHTHRFRGPVQCLRFSPDGKHFAACVDSRVFVFKSPGQFAGEFNPFRLKFVFTKAVDDTTCLDWTSDSRIVAVGSKDGTTRLFPLERLANFTVASLGSHSDSIVAVFFEGNSLDMTTISRNGQICVWESTIEPSDLKEARLHWARKKRKEDLEDEIDLTRGELRDEAVEQGPVDATAEPEAKPEDVAESLPLQYKRLTRQYLNSLIRPERDSRLHLTAANYHKQSHILVTGFSVGSFFIHELPSVTLIHSLSVSEGSIDSIAVNASGEWAALGCSERGQLLVWEWQSETYVMKQQGHATAMTCLAYSPDGQYLVTGGEDAKVKLWSTLSGFCFVTFTEHTSSITNVKFANSRKFVVSASLDGTIRAFDMTRYRNFRTFTSPRPVQFACLALDSAGEFVAAGGQDVFEIYLWSIRVGRLLEVLSGHEGPVVSIAFNPSAASTALASVSWDRTLRLWNAVETGTQHETVQLSADGLCVAYRPDGKEVVVATLDGQLTRFNVQTAEQLGSVEGRNDLGSGRLDTDLITAKKSLKAKAFTTVCYSADGEYVLAGGQSKNICIYNMEEGMLVKKFTITQNKSLDAIDDLIDRRKLSEFGNLALIEEREDGNVKLRLPGARKGDMAARSFKPEVRVFAVQFSPTGLAWAAASTEGLLIYSLDPGHLFDPFLLEEGITPDSVMEALKDKNYAEALMKSLRLNEQPLIRKVIESTPSENVELAVVSLPPIYAEKALRFLATEMESTRHVEFYLVWIQSLLTVHGTTSQPILLTLHKNMSKKYQDLAKICDFNKYTLQYLQRVAKLKMQAKEPNETAGVMEEEMEDNPFGENYSD